MPNLWLRPAAALAFAVVVGMHGVHAADLTESEARSYRTAYDEARNGDQAAAERAAFHRYDPSLVDALKWVAMIRGGASFADVTRFIDAHPDWPDQTGLLERAEEASAGVPDATLDAWFAKHPPISIAGKLRAAEVAIDQGRRDQGLALVRQVWIDADFDRVDERSFYQRYHGMLRQEDHIARLDRLIWAGQSRDAQRLYPLVPDGYRALAEARLALAGLEPGAERLIARVPANLQSDPGLLYERVRWRRRKEHYADAIALLDTAPREQTHADAWAVEREVLARYALAARDDKVAYHLASSHGPVTGAHFAELEFLSGWIALRFLHQPDAAYDHFVRLYDTVKLPISRARGAYWSARGADAMGYRQLAQTWYATAAEFITTYYGQLAATQIGAPGASRIVEPQPTASDAAGFNRRPLVKVARAFARIGADDYVRTFLHDLSDHAETPVDHALVARLATEIGRPDLAIAAAKRASYAGVTLLAEGYPLEEVPRGGRVERPLVLAMTRQESAFDGGAVSTAGARGLMQLMPATASNVARSLQMPFSQKRLTTDVRYNLTLGGAYLSGLLDNFAGSYVLAVAAYNAGPARVHEWMQDFGDPRTKNVDVIDWIESIPVAETRNYVQRVLENLQVYRFRLGDTRLAFSLDTDLRR